ncbi:P1 family peptidase [Steroidobacter sp.]|uniref:DmpA family aminopeptidase n=1 Tax=Steroidobacter sp. TaxID=1978227 RepID=UPI001A454713|nr:P1 family peptidase [Steroidobacter sp.]MBL8268729.1 P1 family peptidase [Steroidobacter sp.]
MKWNNEAVLRRLATMSLLVACAMSPALQAEAVQARDLGVPFAGTPGRYNAITDVDGVEVGYVTLIEGEGHLDASKGIVRTGVTAILPRGKHSTTPVFAGWETSNAAGEMTGTVWLEERGYIDGPVMITNTHSVGVVRDAVVQWLVSNQWPGDWFVPVVGETYDGFISDINGFHVTREHALASIASARPGPVAQGNVGGGTGMACFGFKGGTGTASRVVQVESQSFVVGVLVQCNFGKRQWLRIGGAPVGEALADKYLPGIPGQQRTADGRRPNRAETGDGSIIVVVATDAPLLPHQLKRLAKRPAAGMGRMGDAGSDGSGDIFIAFSTANPNIESVEMKPKTVRIHPNDQLTPIFEAAVQATEEAITNAMINATSITGVGGFGLVALPHDELRAILKKYGRLQARKN